MAIYKELDTSMYDGMTILESANYTPVNIMVPRNVPIVETADGLDIVKFSDVSILAEDYDVSYLDAMVAIAEANDIDPDNVSVAIDEADIILNPSLAESFNNFIVRPISENSLAYKYCKTLVEAFEETEDMNYLLAIIDEADIGSGGFTELYYKAKSKQDQDNLTAYKQAMSKGDTTAAEELKKRLAASGYVPKQDIGKIEKNMKEYNNSWSHKKDVAVSKIKTAGKNAKEFTSNNKGKLAVGAGLAAAATAGIAYKKYNDSKQMMQLAAIQRQMANAPKSWIAKKIASLRGLYQNYMHRAQAAKATGQAGIFTKVAHRILAVIDALMKKMQNMAG